MCIKLIVFYCNLICINGYWLFTCFNAFWIIHIIMIGSGWGCFLRCNDEYIVMQFFTKCVFAVDPFDHGLLVTVLCCNSKIWGLKSILCTFDRSQNILFHPFYLRIYINILSRFVGFFICKDGKFIVLGGGVGGDTKQTRGLHLNCQIYFWFTKYKIQRVNFLLGHS